MKLEIERADFLKAWQTAEKYTPSKTTMEALNGVRITAYEGIVTLEATDLKSSVKCSAKGAAILEPGVAVLNAAIFGSMLRKAEAPTLTLTIGDEKGSLNAGRSKSRFTVIPAETFPNIPESSDAEDICEIMAQDLNRLITEGSCAASAPSDFPKYLGTCMLRTSDGMILAVSTDGKRLARSQMPCSLVNKQDDLILPSAALKELAKSFSGDGSVKILADSSTVWFRLEDGSEFSLRRIDAAFPKYEKILNDAVKTKMIVGKSALVSAIDRVDVMAKTNPAHIMAMVLNPGGELRITARAPELGTISETLDAVIEGEQMHIGFNLSYFMDGVKSINSDSVLAEFSDYEGQTRMFKDEGRDFLYMLMPIRLSPQDIVNDDDADDSRTGEYPPETQQEESIQEQQEAPQESEAPQNNEEPHEFGEGNYDTESPF